LCSRKKKGGGLKKTLGAQRKQSQKERESLEYNAKGPGTEGIDPTNRKKNPRGADRTKLRNQNKGAVGKKELSITYEKGQPHRNRGPRRGYNWAVEGRGAEGGGRAFHNSTSVWVQKIKFFEPSKKSKERAGQRWENDADMQEKKIKYKSKGRVKVKNSLREHPYDQRP